MKRIHLIICLLFQGLLSFAQSIEDLSFGTDSTFDVATWNIEWFPKNGQITGDYVSRVIEALDLDVLAIQEIEDISAFNELVNGLPAYEGYLESSYFAGLAYIYNNGTVQINDMYEIYTTSPYWSPFPRSPMVMDMNVMGQRIILINNHFKCCGDGILQVSNPGDEETRRYIASNLLKEYIDNYFPDENVIVLGDLNDVLSDDADNNVFQQIMDDYEHFLFADFEIASGNESEWSYPSWPSHLDHILITDELFDDFENAGSLIQTIKVEEYVSGGWSSYDANISDHRPVAMKLAWNQNLSHTDPGATAPLFTSFPNPFVNETRFTFGPSAGQRELEIVNVLGQVVLAEKIPGGETTFIWTAEGLPGGVYIAKLLLENKDFVTLRLLLTE